MKSCKHSIWKILSAVAMLALMLPRLALGEFGVCPPYSDTFGPGDSPGDIVSFMNAASTRPGGATARLLPGEYTLEGLAPVSGVLCVLGTGGSSDPLVRILGPGFLVGTDGILTVRSLRLEYIEVSSGGKLFADNIKQLYRGGGDDCDYVSSPGLVIDAFGFAQVVGSSLHQARNEGVLIITHSEMKGACSSTFSGSVDVLHNSGRLHASELAITGNALGSKYYGGEAALSNAEGAVASIRGSTIARNSGAEAFDGGVYNRGHLELAGSIVAENEIGYPPGQPPLDCDNYGEFVDLGGNVFGEGGGCSAAHPTSIEADPQFLPDSIELGAGSPAIDRIPLALCSETDALGRARTDGDGDGIVACDAGALEYGYAYVEARVRALPYYWREVGEVDLSSQTALYMYVFSTETFDATSLVPDSIQVEGFEDDARRGFAFYDPNGDGLTDIQTRYRLDRMPPLSCGYHDHGFSAMTEDGREVAGQLKFDAVGCVP